MLQLLIWAGLSGLITVGVGAAIVVVNRRREREALELAILEDVADRVDALDGVEDRLARLSKRLDAAEQTMLPPEER